MKASGARSHATRIPDTASLSLPASISFTSSLFPQTLSLSIILHRGSVWQNLFQTFQIEEEEDS